MLVERVEEAVAEAPEEEKNRHQTNRKQRLSQSQLGSFGAAGIICLERPPLEKLLERHGDVVGGVFRFESLAEKLVAGR